MHVAVWKGLKGLVLWGEGLLPEWLHPPVCTLQVGAAEAAAASTAAPEHVVPLQQLAGAEDTFVGAVAVAAAVAVAVMVAHA